MFRRQSKRKRFDLISNRIQFRSRKELFRRSSAKQQWNFLSEIARRMAKELFMRMLRARRRLQCSTANDWFCFEDDNQRNTANEEERKDIFVNNMNACRTNKRPSNDRPFSFDRCDTKQLQTRNGFVLWTPAHFYSHAATLLLLR